MTTTETPPTTSDTELIGWREIAALLGVKYGTVRQWKWRGTGPNPLPEPAATVGGSPVWHRGAIVAWAQETGRLPAPEADVEVLYGKNGTGPQRWRLGTRLCGLVGCFEVHRARNRCRKHYHELTGA